MQCSNPIQCQMAIREECSCDCQGQNHGVLRKRLIDSNPEVAAQAQQDLIALRTQQSILKKQKSAARRKRRAAAEKVPDTECNKLVLMQRSVSPYQEVIQYHHKGAQVD